ncbi:hypothetical protein Hamer_G002773 [Homarus americanus]|uniref:Uncharacterized protein n=1 Tax=Homarus americanus TaxID=6706 RepID=A0A8J5JSX0_HOMAM|nr:hypothetical protein Hamer_G002773 [Homarus americanus]
MDMVPNIHCQHCAYDHNLADGVERGSKCHCVRTTVLTAGHLNNYIIKVCFLPITVFITRYDINDTQIKQLLMKSTTLRMWRSEAGHETLKDVHPS